mmetsp:Transcript_36474/g.117832  ORF Transcript_36474/g.117832 Transcript_36474/m.117832 type:complete len:234 (+) Transcript_36474:215-916(+)
MAGVSAAGGAVGMVHTAASPPPPPPPQSPPPPPGGHAEPTAASARCSSERTHGSHGGAGAPCWWHPEEMARLKVAIASSPMAAAPSVASETSMAVVVAAAALAAALEWVAAWATWAGRTAASSKQRASRLASCQHGRSQLLSSSVAAHKPRAARACLSSSGAAHPPLAKASRADRSEAAQAFAYGLRLLRSPLAVTAACASAKPRNASSEDDAPSSGAVEEAAIGGQTAKSAK